MLVTVARRVSSTVFGWWVQAGAGIRPMSSAQHINGQQGTQPQQEEDAILYRKIDVEVRGHDRAVLDSYETFINTTTQHMGLELTDRFATDRPLKRRWTVLRSVHIYKKHRTQYETRTHLRRWTVPRLTGSTADTFLEYIQRNLPEGCAMKVDRHQLLQLPQTIQLDTYVPLHLRAGGASARTFVGGREIAPDMGNQEDFPTLANADEIAAQQEQTKKKLDQINRPSAAPSTGAPVWGKPRDVSGSSSQPTAGQYQPTPPVDRPTYARPTDRYTARPEPPREEDKFSKPSGKGYVPPHLRNKI